MNLRELLNAVQEKNLTKTMLEDYHTELTHLYSLLLLEKSDLEKDEALYFLNHEQKSDIAAVRKWKGSAQGQRLIELDNYSKVITKNLQSLKSRMYSQY